MPKQHGCSSSKCCAIFLTVCCRTRLTKSSVCWWLNLKINYLRCTLVDLVLRILNIDIPFSKDYNLVFYATNLFIFSLYPFKLPRIIFIFCWSFPQLNWWWIYKGRFWNGRVTNYGFNRLWYCSFLFCALSLLKFTQLNWW